MSLRWGMVSLLTVLLALGVLAVACSGDDDDGAGNGGDDAGSTETMDVGDGDVTETATPDGDAGEPTGDASDFDEDFGLPEAGFGGNGTVTIGSETYAYDVIACSVDQGVYVLSGRGHDLGGQPFVAEVGVTFGDVATAEVSVGSSSVSDDGDPHWTAEPVLNYEFGANGIAVLRFDATFTDSSGAESDGSVDVTCEL
jgi:hypothetical protein